MFEVKREDYVAALVSRRQNGLVKIITGVRRSGKSYLLFRLFMRWLREQGVDEGHIIALALDDFANRQYLEGKELYWYIKNRITDHLPYYILIDEVQLVEGFEAVLNGFLHIDNADVYVTGSNSRFLSTDIITEFRGRGDEVRIFPFSFAEYYSVVGGDKGEAWSTYCRYGGMPQAVGIEGPREKEAYLKTLFSNVYLSDIIGRYKLRSHGEIDTLVDVLASSVGSMTNPRRIADTFASSAGITLSQPTIASYISYLEDAFLVSRAMRYDVKGRRYIGTPMKYYFVDVGLRNARLNFRQQEEKHLMENVIYNELLRRGFSVDVGVVHQYEVDFVANMGSKRYYIQSAYDMPSPEKVAQEKRSLMAIPDSFAKIIIQRPPIAPWHDNDGILHLDLMNFLLDAHSIDR